MTGTSWRLLPKIGQRSPRLLGRHRGIDAAVALFSRTLIALSWRVFGPGTNRIPGPSRKKNRVILMLQSRAPAHSGAEWARGRC